MRWLEYFCVTWNTIKVKKDCAFVVLLVKFENICFINSLYFFFYFLSLFLILPLFSGILFLTTNRVMTFDDAICSRVNMFFYYPRLDSEGRHEIWTNFIRRANLPLNADDFVKYDLNGREIRNILHTTQLLVKSKGTDLTADTVIEIIKTFQGFQEEMEVIRSNYEENSKEIKKV